MARKRGRARNNTGSIVRQPDGSYRAFVTGKGPNGKSKRLSKSGFPTARSAQAWIDEKTGMTRAGYVYSGRTTFGELVDGWLQHKSSDLRPNTRRSYQNAARLIANHPIHGVKVENLTTGHVRGLYDTLTADGLSAGQLAILGVVVRGVCEYGAEYMPANPALSAKPPRYHKGKVIEMWTESQVSAFLRQAQGDPLEPLFRLAFASGMRNSELRGLPWSNVDWVRGAVTVTQQIVDIERSTGKPKSDSGYRTILLAKSVIERLGAQLRRVEAMKAAAGADWQGDEYNLVFPNRRGLPLSSNNLRDHFYEIARQANLPHIRFHGVRHTFVSLLLLRGVAPAIVAEMIGDTIETVIKTYAHIIPGRHEEAARVMGELTTVEAIEIRLGDEVER